MLRAGGNLLTLTGAGGGGLGGQPGLLSPRSPGCPVGLAMVSAGPSRLLVCFPICSRGSGEMPASGVTAEEGAGT